MIRDEISSGKTVYSVELQIFFMRSCFQMTEQSLNEGSMKCFPGTVHSYNRQIIYDHIFLPFYLLFISCQLLVHIVQAITVGLDTWMSDIRDQYFFTECRAQYLVNMNVLFRITIMMMICEYVYTFRMMMICAYACMI